MDKTAFVDAAEHLDPTLANVIEKKSLKWIFVGGALRSGPLRFCRDLSRM